MLARLTCTAITASPFVLSTVVVAATARPACPPGEHWVNAHHRSAYIRADGTPVSASHVRSHCQANPPSDAAWAERLRKGMPPRWGKPREKPKAWTEEERERVLEAIAALPDALIVIPLEGIYRLSKSFPESENPGAGHAGDIALYDSAFRSDRNLSRVLAHELAHKLYERLSESDARDYNAVAGWIVTRTASGTRVFVPRLDGFVEADGIEGPNEDFSNNIEHYLFNSKSLHERTPKVYAWIRKRFGEGFKLRGALK